MLDKADIERLLDIIYPVGSIIEMDSSITDPIKAGYPGRWVMVADVFEFDASNKFKRIG